MSLLQHFGIFRRRPLSGNRRRRRAPASGQPTSQRLVIERLEQRTVLDAGGLDTTFGSSGLQSIGFNLGGGTGSLNDDRAFATAVDSSGRMVLAGYASRSTSGDRDFAVVRLLPNGTLDTSFSSDGKAVAFFDLGGNKSDEAHSLAIQPDGKIVVAGYAVTADGGADFAIARFNTNGTLDTTFSGDGKATVSFNLGGTNFDSADAIAIQPDGKIIVAGLAEAASDGGHFAVARLNANGALDTTFSGDGKQTVAFNRKSDANDMVLQPDGKIVLAGSVFVGTGIDLDFAAARLNANGTLDTTFSSDGKVAVAFDLGDDDGDIARSVALQADGKILLAGSAELATGSTMAIARLTATGSLDSSFGVNGKTTVQGGTSSAANDVLVQHSGRILLAGHGTFPGTANTDFAAVRLLPSGQLDPSFDGDGRAAFNFNLDSTRPTDNAYAAAIWSDKLYLAGRAWKGSSNYEFAAARVDLDRFESIIGRANGAWWAAVGGSGATDFDNLPLVGWSSTAPWVDVLTADVNGDGLDDIVGRENGRWWVSVNRGLGEFVTSQFGAWSNAVTWTDVQAADLNADGREDIIGRTGGQWWAAISNGTRLNNVLFTTWATSGVWQDIRVGDVTADGRADVMGRLHGQWWVGVSNGTSFSNQHWGAWSTAINWTDVRIGDINGDGRADLTGRVATAGPYVGQWWVALSTGTAFVNRHWGTWSSSSTWTDVRLTDVTGDGRADLVGRTNGRWWVEVSTGSSFTSQIWGLWSTTGTWVDVVFGDFDDDGKTDIAGRLNGAWWVARSTGASFQSSVWGAWSTAVTWKDVQVGAG